MDMISVKEAASEWNTSPRRVSLLCAEGRIEGAEHFGNAWAIPKGTQKPTDARVRNDFNNDCKVKPIIKWAGGKGQLLDSISSAYPKGLGTEITKYAEPFIGGAAVLLDVLSKYELESVYISDINRELVHLYMVVRDNLEDITELLQTYQNEHISRDSEGRKEYFYTQRTKYNEIKASSKVDWVECSALFVYLNKTCFNGLYRVNSKGEFNVPSGVYKNPCICDSQNLSNVSELLQGVIIKNADYTESRAFIDDNTFVYFDPPYRPLNITSSFTSYTENQFNDDNQISLANYAKELCKIGAKVMLSNSDPKNTDPGDTFFDDLYEEMNIYRVSATRMINSKGTGRGKINELLITNYPTFVGQLMIDEF